jgi:DNA-dependent protein kinase catalytic subunit
MYVGSDGRQSMFLVKGGEDLRNDERIELLFDLMNLVISTSTSSTTLNEENLKISNNNLRALTYSVIPMTSRMGIMEWVSDTQTLKAVVSGIYVYLYEYL